MSKPEITTINSHRLARGVLTNSSTNGNPDWDAIRVVADESASDVSMEMFLSDAGNGAPLNSGGGASSSGANLHQTSRGGPFYHAFGQRFLFSFDTSGISSRDPIPSSGTISIPLKRSNIVNLASDHKVILAMATSDAIASDATIVDDDTNVQAIEGGPTSGGDSWDSTLAKASEPFNLTDLSTGSSPTEIALTSTALKAIRDNDVVGIWIIDYTYTVLDQNPATAAPSAGAQTSYSLQKYDTATFCVLTITAGGKKDEVPDKDRIEKDFTINSFADITDQRTRFTKNGVIVDQVPFLLGTKGPLSLRGRQFGDDGKPISSTVKPPNTSRD
jgi:hypothetical protein